MLTQESLDNFTGTESYHKYMGGLMLTDGVKYLAEQGKCWWIIDIIWSYQHKLKNSSAFQLWELNIDEEMNTRSAVITCKEDSDKKPLITQKIPHTDFPMDYLKLYCIDKVILLPSEY